MMADHDERLRTRQKLAAVLEAHRLLDGVMLAYRAGQLTPVDLVVAIDKLIALYPLLPRHGAINMLGALTELLSQARRRQAEQWSAETQAAAREAIKRAGRVGREGER